MADPKDAKKPKTEATTSGIFTLDPEDFNDHIPGVTTLLSVKRDHKKITSLEETRTFSKEPATPPVKAEAKAPAPASTPAKAPAKKEEEYEDLREKEISLMISTPESTAAFPISTNANIEFLEQVGAAAAGDKTTIAAKKLRDYGVVFELHFDLKDGSYFQYAKVVNHQKSTLEPWQLVVLEKAVFRVDLMGLRNAFTEYTQQQQSGFIFDALGMDPKLYIQVIQVHSPGKRIHVLISQTTLFAKKDELIALIRSTDEEMSGTIEVDLAS